MLKRLFDRRHRSVKPLSLIGSGNGLARSNLCPRAHGYSARRSRWDCARHRPVLGQFEGYSGYAQLREGVPDRLHDAVLVHLQKLDPAWMLGLDEDDAVAHIDRA